MDDAARGQNPLPSASKVARERGGGEEERKKEKRERERERLKVIRETRQGETHVFQRPIK